MSILFVAPSGMDENSDRARCVAGKCRGVEIRDIDVHRLNEMPPKMRGVPTLVEGDEMLMGSDCLAALVDMMTDVPVQSFQQPSMPQPYAQQSQPPQQTQPQAEPQQTLSERGSLGTMSANDVQQKLNEYRNSMNVR